MRQAPPIHRWRAFSTVSYMFAEGAERNQALGIWGALAALGATAGVVFGGLLTRFAGWQYIFWLNVPVGAVALLLIRRVVPETRIDAARRRDDPLGAMTVTGGLVLVAYAIAQAPRVGWGAARTIVEMAIGVGLLVAFLAVERRAEAPLLPLRIFRLQTLAGANAVGVMLGASFYSFIFIGTLYMQQVIGFSALDGGLAWAASGIAIASSIAASHYTTLLRGGGDTIRDAIPVTFLLIRKDVLAKSVAATALIGPQAESVT